MGCFQSVAVTQESCVDNTYLKTGHEWYLQLDLYKDVIFWSGWKNATDFYSTRISVEEFQQRIQTCLRTRRMYFDTHEFVYRPMTPLWYPLPASSLPTEVAS
jgi:hypothetical protein